MDFNNLKSMDFEKSMFEKSMLERYADLAKKSGYIDPELYTRYEVKKGLRDLDGRGVLVGLTEIGTLSSKRVYEILKGINLIISMLPLH
jgi:hypothetical protein